MGFINDILLDFNYWFNLFLKLLTEHQ